jgi:hypothetical protein
MARPPTSVPGQIFALEVGAALVHEVDELVGLASELDDEALVDRRDVGSTRAGDELLLQVFVLGVVVARVEHDLDVRMGRFVFGLEFVEAHVAPEGDLERDRAALVAAALELLPAAAGDRQSCREPGGGQPQTSFAKPFHHASTTESIH